MPLRTIRRTLLSIALTIAVIAIVADAFCVVVDKIVAVVNSEVITQHETTQLLIPIYEQYRKEYTGKRLENKMLEAEDMVLKQLIDDKLILSEAKVQDIRAADKEIERKLETVKSRFETDEAFRSALAEQNLTLSELRERFRGDIIKGKLVRRQMGLNVTITPIEVRKYYDEHIDDFREPAKAKVLNILIKKDGRTEEEALFLVEKVRELIENGQDFEGLAREYSQGPNAEKGGGMGFLEKGEMMEEIDDAVFSLEAGDISDIVESPIGYHVFKVTEKTPKKNVDFEIVKYEIEDLIYKKRVDKKLKNWLKTLRKNAYISIK